MFPSRNLNEFENENNGGVFGTSLDEIYITFVQSRINTNLMLINNPNLIEQFGLNFNEIVEETKRLLKISSYVKIPDTVPEKKDRRFFK